MSLLETTKANLKRLASDSLELALKELERLLSPESPLFNSFLLLKGQFKKCREEFLLGMLSPEQNTQTYARLMSAFLQMTGDLSHADLIPEKETAQKPAEKRGELLYHVPHTMQVMREEKCVVRIAWTEAALFENWKRRKDDIHRRNLRIAEVMGVELLSLSEDAPFSIKSLHSTVQFLDEEEYTEWIFYVKPLRAGNYPLVIRISVIEMRDNREVKRELVLEEQVSVTTEAPQVEMGQEDMVRAPMAYFAAGAPFVEAPAFLTEVMRRYGALFALVLIGVMAVFMPWKWGNDDIVVVPPNDNDSTKVDSDKIKLNFLQPFQEEESHFVLDKSKILQDFSNDEPSVYYTDSSIVLTLHGLSADLDLILFGTNNGNGDSLNFRQEFVQGNKANYQKEYKLNKLTLPSASENINNGGEKNIYVEQIAKKDASPPLTKDSSSRYSLFVDGSVISEEVKVTLGSDWADYVFTPHYPRSAIDSFLLTKHGLTEIQILQDSADKLIQFYEDRLAQLNAQVDNSSFINITNFSVTPKSQRSKSTITSKKRGITSFLICFTTLANPLVKNGHQIFYLRLLSESGESLQIGSQEIIAHGQLIKHTLPIIVDYDGTSKEICLQWESTEKLISGRYKLEIFNNDRLVGLTMFNLK